MNVDLAFLIGYRIPAWGRGPLADPWKNCEVVIFVVVQYNNNNTNNLTNSNWSIGSTKNVKEDRAQITNKRNCGGMETQFQCG